MKEGLPCVVLILNLIIIVLNSYSWKGTKFTPLLDKALNCIYIEKGIGLLIKELKAGPHSDCTVLLQSYTA